MLIHHGKIHIMLIHHGKIHMLLAERGAPAAMKSRTVDLVHTLKNLPVYNGAKISA
jgi:hypothetical protein